MIRFFSDFIAKREDEDDPFRRTGRLFGGVMNDLKRRMPKYKSDILDGLNFQCFSTIIFLYFASMGLVVTLAGLMGKLFTFPPN